MLTALLFTALAAQDDAFILDWETKNQTTQIALEDGQTYKRTKKLTKRHVRTTFALKATSTKDGRVRLDAEIYDGDVPAQVTVIARFDQTSVLRFDDNSTVRVRVRRSPEAIALVAPSR